MTALSVLNPTLLDYAKALDPNGNIAALVEILNQDNEILDDMTFMQGNLPTGHRVSVRSGIPAPTWRKLYGGVQPTKSRRVQVTESCGMLEAYAEVDKALADLNGNTNAFRLSEDRAHIEGMNQEVASSIFYANEKTSPEEITGLAPRFDHTAAENGQNILTGSGSANNTSIWLIVWSPETVYGIVPKGSQTGLQMRDLGEVTIENADGSNGRMQAYRTHYRWDLGLCVADWRYVVRIANINVANLTKDASGSSADLITLMIKATELVQGLGMGRPAFYCNRTIKTFLRLQMLNKSNVNLTLEQFNRAGTMRNVLAFDGIPIRRCDAILNSESTVGA